MTKNKRRNIALCLTLGGFFSLSNMESINIYADSISNSNSIEYKEVSEEKLELRRNQIMSNPSYKKDITVEEKIIDNNIKLEIKSVNYKLNLDDSSTFRISNGTKFGTFSTIRVLSVPHGYHMGTVNIDTQAQKINSNSAKINYMRYSNKGFNRYSKGAYKSLVHSAGNPAKGSVYVSYVYYFDGEHTSQNKIIPVRAYPTGRISVG